MRRKNSLRESDQRRQTKVQGRRRDCATKRLFHDTLRSVQAIHEWIWQRWRFHYETNTRWGVGDDSRRTAALPIQDHWWYISVTFRLLLLFIDVIFNASLFWNEQHFLSAFKANKLFYSLKGSSLYKFRVQNKLETIDLCCNSFN